MPKFDRATRCVALLFSLAMLPACGCKCTPQAKPASVHVPKGFDFAACGGAITGEYDSEADFYQRYFERMGGTPMDDTYGMAMAPDGAVIGDQPLSIDVEETIVVSTAGHKYPLWYYDTPNTYFNALAKWCRKPLKIVPVDVTEYGKADNVVAEVRRIGAKVIGIRVKSAREHAAVAAWLREDPNHRAVLFHTASYPDGEKLFAEFPHQTTFGDIHPKLE